MSDIGLNWGNFFDLLIGVPLLGLVLLLLVIGIWRRWRRWHLVATGLALGVGVDFLHSLAYARETDRGLTFLLMAVALLLTASSSALAWRIPPRARKPTAEQN